jgi:DNA-directed RNA polymerase specialized sigma24 family protein
MAPSARFPTTQWTLVLSASEPTDMEGSGALSALCEGYWYPLYAYIRRSGHSAENAQDLTQAFFARIIEKRYLDRADPNKGRFRAFLLSSLKFFLSDEADREHALKRGGLLPPIPFDIQRGEEFYRFEPVHSDSPDKIFERRWALTLLERVLESLKLELAGQGKEADFGVLKTFLVQDNTPYADAAEKLNTTEGALKVAVHRLRKRYRDLFRAEIANTVASPDEVDDEIRYLARALRRE